MQKYILNNTICFIGLPGCGKTWLSSSLGKDLNLPFLDLDMQIEKHFGWRIVDIWNRFGEKAFRIQERRELFKALTGNPIIISCGGGTPSFFDNMAIINELAKSFYIKSSVELLVTKMETINRPIFDSGEEILSQMEKLLNIRIENYNRAHYCIDSYLVEPKVLTNVKQICFSHNIIKQSEI